LRQDERNEYSSHYRAAPRYPCTRSRRPANFNNQFLEKEEKHIVADFL
jgi:hypothetical protein